MTGRAVSWILPSRKNHVPMVAVDSQKNSTLPTTNHNAMSRSLPILMIS